MPDPGTRVSELSVKIQGSIATVTFASPSLRRTLQEDLWRTMDALETNPDVTVVVFTGRRNVFMTGADLGEILALKDRRSAAEYLDLLAPAGCEVDAWETTYLHVLPGQDPVVEWYRGTGLRPVLAALDPGRAERFLAEYSERIAKAYPAAPYGTVLPFRRVFVVAQVA